MGVSYDYMFYLSNYYCNMVITADTYIDLYYNLSITLNVKADYITVLTTSLIG